MTTSTNCVQMKAKQSQHRYCLMKQNRHYSSGSQNFSDGVPFVAAVLSSRTTLFQEKSMCQISFDQKSGKPELTQMQREQNGCEKF